MESIKEKDANIYKEIFPLIMRIRSFKCPNCGGYFENDTCRYCRQENKEYASLLEKLNGYLPTIETFSKLSFSKSLNLLCILRVNYITEVDKLLNKLQFYNKYQQTYINALTNLENNESVNEEEEVIAINELYSGRSDITLENILVKRSLMGKSNIPYEYFKKALENIIISYLRPYYRATSKGSIAPIESHKEGWKILGSSCHNKITLDESDAKALYTGKSYNFLITLFHEIRHSFIAQYLYKDNIYKDIVKILKERIIVLAYPDYYYENYMVESGELDAEICSYNLLISYFQQLGFILNPEFIQQVNNEQNRLQQLYEIDFRTYHGEETTVDEMFNKALSEFPQYGAKYSYIRNNYMQEKM